VVVDVAAEPVLEHVLDVCSAAGVVPTVVSGAWALRREVEDADLAVLDSAAAARLEPARTRAMRVLVTASPPTESEWRRAMAVGVDDVCVLPSGADALMGHLAEVAVAQRGRLVGVLAARGGAGGSTLARALAVRGCARGPSLLVDLDPWAPPTGDVARVCGPGGTAWEDVGDVNGRLEPGLFLSSLPQLEDARVLGFSGDSLAAAPRPEVVRSVLDAAGRGCALTVLDVPRTADALDLLAACGSVVIVAPTELGGLSAAHVIGQAVAEVCSDVFLVLRSRRRRSAAEAAAALGLPVVAVVREDVGVRRDAESGIPPGARRGSQLRGVADAVLDAVGLGVPGRRR
jgi:secretion/DNA translocation related CpaE-like protein